MGRKTAHNKLTAHAHAHAAIRSAIRAPAALRPHRPGQATVTFATPLLVSTAASRDRRSPCSTMSWSSTTPPQPSACLRS